MGRLVSESSHWNKKIYEIISISFSRRLFAFSGIFSKGAGLGGGFRLRAKIEKRAGGRTPLFAKIAKLKTESLTDSLRIPEGRETSCLPCVKSAAAQLGLKDQSYMVRAYHGDFVLELTPAGVINLMKMSTLGWASSTK